MSNDDILPCAYPKTSDSAINRHKERGHYDAETVHGIINSTPVAHVSFIPDPSDPKPVVLPMIARVASFNNQDPAVYIHGYVSARMFSTQARQPVCVAATKIDNLVLALTPFNHSYDYRSAVVHGTAALLDPGTKSSPANRDEIGFALQLITDSMVTDRWANTRAPDEAEIAATRVLKVRIESASAKIRDSGVSDDAKDLKSNETTARVWTGVIPYVEMLGEPQPAGTNKVAGIPSYVEEHVRAHNQKAGAGFPVVSGGLAGKVLASLLVAWAVFVMTR
ncbi:hypothetical protein KVR01_011048 [Diaporthe batatas]|uniref:uncharacterized protein n=1 Tax=Diaporthe batatas TaxID=748121 RepID=UPI001D0481E9|nr:uncharacterized protein KVR01_011048 [Diaporthe batatas]KAG8159387.1 hypothetical protein KVR01_011048 [Diaporthe batatas]